MSRKPVSAGDIAIWVAASEGIDLPRAIAEAIAADLGSVNLRALDDADFDGMKDEPARFQAILLARAEQDA